MCQHKHKKESSDRKVVISFSHMYVKNMIMTMNKLSTFYSHSTINHEQKNNKNKVIGPTVVTASHTEAFTNARPANQAVARYGREGKYFPTKLLFLFIIMERVLPIMPTEWEKLVAEYSLELSGCDVDSIHRKYITLYRTKIPTGDPNITLGVRMAKCIKYKIGDKAELDDITAEYDI